MRLVILLLPFNRWKYWCLKKALPKVTQGVSIEQGLKPSPRGQSPAFSTTSGLKESFREEPV